MKDSNSIEEMKKALKCLYLDVHSSIADDLVKKFEAVLQSQDIELEKDWFDKWQSFRTEAITIMFNCEDKTTGIYPTSYFFEMLDNYVKKLVNQKGNDSGWVSVEDKNRLPEEGNCYLCYLKMKEGYGHAYDTLCLVNGDFGVFDNKKYDVTHWRPLPTPPIQSKL